MFQPAVCSSVTSRPVRSTTWLVPVSRLPSAVASIAVLDEMAVSNRDQRTADSRTPVRLVHEDAVQLADRGVHRIAARTDFSASDDRARALGNPRPGVGQAGERARRQRASSSGVTVRSFRDSSPPNEAFQELT